MEEEVEEEVRMVVLEERQLPTSTTETGSGVMRPVHCLSWSPTIDVLAVITLPGKHEAGKGKGGGGGGGVELSCFRLDTWARLWTENVAGSGAQGDVCAVWAPHGKALAVAQRDGKAPASSSSGGCSLSLVDVEAGAVFSPHTASIAHEVNVMLWAYNSGAAKRDLHANLAVQYAVERLQRAERLAPAAPTTAAATSAAGVGGTALDNGGRDDGAIHDEYGGSRASIARNAMNAEMMTMMMTSTSSVGDVSSLGFDVLIAAGRDHVSLLSKGVFQIATVNLRHVLAAAEAKSAHTHTGGVPTDAATSANDANHIKLCRPVAVNLNSTCNELAVLLEVERHHAAAAEPGHGSSNATINDETASLCLATFRTHFSSPSVLSNVLTASTLTTSILSLTDSAAHDYRRSLERYVGVIGSFERKLDGLRRLMNDSGMAMDDENGRGSKPYGHAPSNGVSATRNDKIKREMHACLLHGAGDAPALAQWLTADLGESGLRRIAKQVDTASAELLKTITSSVARDCNELLFIVGELKSLAVAYAATSASGTDDDDVFLFGNTDSDTGVDGKPHAAVAHEDFDCEHTIGVGYDVDMLATLEEDCLVLVLLLELLTANVTQRACMFRSFFTFLLHTIRTLNNDPQGGNANAGGEQGASAEAANANTLHFDSDLVVKFLDAQLDDLGEMSALGRRTADADISASMSIDILSTIPKTHLDALGLTNTIERLALRRGSSGTGAKSHVADGANSVAIFTVPSTQMSQIRRVIEEELLRPRENVVSPPLALVQVMELERYDKSSSPHETTTTTGGCGDMGEEHVSEEETSLTSLVAPLSSEHETAGDARIDSDGTADGFLVAFKSRALSGDIVIARVGADADSDTRVSRLGAPGTDFTVKALQIYKDDRVAVMLSGRKNTECDGAEDMPDNDEEESADVAHISIVDTKDLAHVTRAHADVAHDGERRSLPSLQQRTLCDILAESGVRSIIPPHTIVSCGMGSNAQAPYLAVSGSRGIGLAVVGTRRVKVYDFEAEDDDEDEDGLDDEGDE